MFLSERASAEPASWVSVASGPAFVQRRSVEEVVPLLRMNAGLAIRPSHDLIVGAGFEFGTFLGHGSDVGGAMRVATGAYTRGDWGLALDLGAYHRFNRVSDGGAATLTLGAPWGLLLAANGTLGTHDARSIGVLFGFDFARLTVHRTSGQQWWPNPLAERGERSRRLQPASAMSLR